MITLANSKSSKKSKNYNAAAAYILKCYSMMMTQQVKPSWVKLEENDLIIKVFFQTEHM